ncbi:U-scoloptoxin(05)-Cw1a [Contarinia nasturtii]|uniref:U-scoloptoxin(05)-Cw1a n=1 Tax=Contarinia nasturtii TaxID=265458 RepID=UPI0012D4ABB9|nr:U-scoloptoxin(05)-Cw1a [Contarinia nasturtii]
MRNYTIISAVLFCSFIKIATSISCYVCNATDSSSPFQCGEWFERYDTPDIVPQDCSNVYGAKYCIKHIGRFEASSIKCYQCSSADTINCADIMIAQPDSPLQPEDCSHVIDAKFCVKSTALNGGIGAKRFCSSKDLGNYCNYVENKGDRMEYRSCIFTCDTDGCNHSNQITLNRMVFGGFLTIIFTMIKLLV